MTKKLGRPPKCESCSKLKKRIENLKVTIAEKDIIMDELFSTNRNRISKKTILLILILTGLNAYYFMKNIMLVKGL